MRWSPSFSIIDQSAHRGGDTLPKEKAVSGIQPTEYDEFGLFHENAEEYGLPYDGPPAVRRELVDLDDGRRLSALVWGSGDPELVLLHGGGQNAHTWDTVALALGRPLVAIDLPGHGHSDAGRESSLAVEGNADDVATVIAALAPNARGVVGMSLGGVTTLALVARSPELVRAAVLVDVTPGVNREKSKMIGDFLNGPVTFANFDEILARTVEYNPTRTVSSLRRGILHNAEQLEDGSWVWRHQRHRLTDGGEQPQSQSDQATPFFAQLWDVIAKMEAPLLLARGMQSQSVVDDEDEAELLRRNPSAKVVHFEHSGHSLQGDEPVKLARVVNEFIS
jgi:pimeloyl-ACP methyl ester carboxylesterase